MLEKIVLVLSNDYKSRIKDSCEYHKFTDNMQANRTMVELWDLHEKCLINLQTEPTEIKNTLYFSDEADMLARLQEHGCYTVALYHEGVSGLLSGTQFAIEGIEDMEWEYLYKVYQRFTGQPWEITQTKRCKIREMAITDIDDLYKLYDSPNVTRYTENLFSDRKQETQYVKEYIENVYCYYGYGVWLIHAKEIGKLIGRAGFTHRPGFEQPELGFVIGEPFWNQGYAYEVCRHLLNLGKQVYQFDKVQALVKEENTVSIHLLEKLGFLFAEKICLDGEDYQRYICPL